MRSLALCIVVASLSDCAPRVAPLSAPRLYPATLAVDFDCLDDGLRADLVRGMERERRDAALKIIQAQKNERIAAAKYEEQRTLAESNAVWAAVGRGGAVAVGVAVVLGAVGLVYGITREK